MPSGGPCHLIHGCTLSSPPEGASKTSTAVAEQLNPLERLVIMNGPNPLCFRTVLRHWRQMRKSWYVAFSQLPRLAERIQGMAAR